MIVVGNTGLVDIMLAMIIVPNYCSRNILVVTKHTFYMLMVTKLTEIEGMEIVAALQKVRTVVIAPIGNIEMMALIYTKYFQ